MKTTADIIFHYENKPAVRFDNYPAKIEKDGKVTIHTQTIKPMYEHYQNCDDLVLKYNGEIYAFIGANEYNLTDVDLMFWR